MTTYVAWNFLGHRVSSLIHLTLTSIGFPAPLIQLILFALPLILLLEVVVKLLLFQMGITPVKFVSTQPESWPNLDKDELIRYTFELEQLGFAQLTDFTGISSSQGMSRLFSHPQKFCLAEVGQVDNFPMFCSIFCYLEEDWFLAVTNMFPKPSLSAISYAFLRRPRNLHKQFENASVNSLLQSLLVWREEVMNDLDLRLIQDVKAETYFEKQRNDRIAQRRSLLRKSITLTLLEVLWFYLNPRSEWLGDYSKLKVKR
ncbi:MAG: hypothetical protein QNJ46_11425 [Leptolyngbyaceae cyanobacterium MO_188.B28]|nr:hypothetical protein [Leptolyngbyaceae cyanobacterium MO_188.B28]